MATEFSILE